MTEESVPGMAQAVERRRVQLQLGKGELAKRANRSREAIRPILAGARRAYEDATIFGVAKALEWQTDWYQRLLAGEEPVPLDGQGPITSSDVELAARVDAFERTTNDRFSSLEVRLGLTDSKVEEILRLLRGREA